MSTPLDSRKDCSSLLANYFAVVRAEGLDRAGGLVLKPQDGCLDCCCGVGLGLEGSDDAEVGGVVHNCQELTFAMDGCCGEGATQVRRDALQRVRVDGL
jgi:hypothetical protein